MKRDPFASIVVLSISVAPWTAFLWSTIGKWMWRWISLTPIIISVRYCFRLVLQMGMFSFLHRSLCYSCLCVVYVFLDAATLTEVFPCFFLCCKANARVNLTKTEHGPHSPKLLCCSMYCFFFLYRSVYCLSVNVYCTAATGWQPNCS